MLIKEYNSLILKLKLTVYVSFLILFSISEPISKNNAAKEYLSIFMFDILLYHLYLKMPLPLIFRGSRKLYKNDLSLG